MGVVWADRRGGGTAEPRRPTAESPFLAAMADPREDDDRRELKRGLKVLAVSWVMALTIVAAGFAGWWLDEHVTKRFPLMTLLAIGAGIVGGGWYAYRTIMGMYTE